MKEIRFRRPEFQQKLRRARSYERKNEPLPQGGASSALRHIGLATRFGQGATVLLFLLILYFLTISRVFLVTNVIAVGGKVTSDQVAGVLARMEKSRIWLIPSNHIFVLSSKRLTTELAKSFPEVRSVTSFKKHLPATVEVAVETREGKYIWRAGDNYYLLDQDGVVFEELQNYDPAVYKQAVITDETEERPKIGQSSGTEKILGFIDALSARWSELIKVTSYRSFFVPGIKSTDVIAETELGFRVYFDLERSARGQVANLNFVLTREIDPATYAGLSYIDLRLPTQAYYCYKDAPCAPEQATSTPIIIK